MTNKHEQVEVHHKHLYGIDLTDDDLIAICEVERNKIKTNVERICGENNFVPPQIVAMIETERLIKSYIFN